MKVEFKFGFNDKVKLPDIGLTGTVRAVDYWSTGCKRYAIQQKMGSDKKVPDLYWADEVQLVLVKRVQTKIKKPIGGPHNNPGVSSFK